MILPPFAFGLGHLNRVILHFVANLFVSRKTLARMLLDQKTKAIHQARKAVSFGKSGIR